VAIKIFLEGDLKDADFILVNEKNILKKKKRYLIE